MAKDVAMVDGELRRMLPDGLVDRLGDFGRELIYDRTQKDQTGQIFRWRE